MRFKHLLGRALHAFHATLLHPIPLPHSPVIQQCVDRVRFFDAGDVISLDRWRAGNGELELTVSFHSSQLFVELS
jgi:hypothetical protein